MTSPSILLEGKAGYRGCIGRTLDRIPILPDGRAYVCSSLSTPTCTWRTWPIGRSYLDQDALFETPARMVRAYAELLTPREFDLTTFDNDEGYEQLVLVQGIPFRSLCEHHAPTRSPETL